jgi:tRNA pseudouridine55 synthase
MQPGIHLLHKPVGPSSFAIVQGVRPATVSTGGSRPRMCHGGTLDPFASGLLLLLVGPATRLFDYLHAAPKAYDATIRWGMETDNGDPLGAPTFQGDATHLSPAMLETLMQTFVGWHEQVPPATSAKRIDGERAYLRVQRGEEVQMPASRVYLHEATWLEHDLPRQSTLRLVARGGYYVRALTRDIGRILGCGAHVGSLHRRAIGPWSDPGVGRQVHLQGRELLPWLASRALSDQEVGRLRQRGDIPPGTIAPPDWQLPEGFAEPLPLVRGLHRDKLIYLLATNQATLTCRVALGRGI